MKNLETFFTIIIPALWTFNYTAIVNLPKESFEYPTSYILATLLLCTITIAVLLPKKDDFSNEYIKEVL